MKTLTLEETVQWMERCISEGADWNEDFWSNYVDTLHYLKEYREKHDEILRMEEALGYCEIMANPPLTWQELRTMAGKPVWIEGEHGCIWDQKAWSLIRLDAENEDIVICVSTDNGVHYEFAIDEEDYGSDWQAYRKERS